MWLEAIYKKKLDKLMVDGEPEAAGVVLGTIEEFARESATVLHRFLDGIRDRLSVLLRRHPKRRMLLAPGAAKDRRIRLRTRFPSNPSSNNFNPVQSISRVRTLRQSLMNRPVSSRLPQMQNPLRSKYRHLICEPRRLMKIYNAPSSGSRSIA